MGQLPLFLILIALGLLITLIIRKRIGVNHLRTDVEIWGARLQVSLHEIFSGLRQPGGLGNLAAIKDNSTGRIIWTAEAEQPPLNTAYYEIGDYTIYGGTPIRINIESIPFLENGTQEKLEHMFGRKAFLQFVDKNGNTLNAPFLIITRMALILTIVFVLLAAILSIHKTFWGSFQGDKK